MRLNTERKVLILGGDTNALSVARNLGRLGVPVHISAELNSVAGYSFYATAPHFLYSSADFETHWKELLIDNPEPSLAGALILALNDAAISFISTYREQLQRRYVLESNDPQLRNRLLDKKETLRIATEAGLDVPKSWRLNSSTDLHELASTMAYPLLVKPIYSHLFHKVFRVKLLLVKTMDEAVSAVETARQHALDVMLCEWVPGPDSNLCSYYAYYDREGTRVTEFTKYVIRRLPQYFGGGVYHGTSWQGDVAEAGRRFFDHLGMWGICNIEFKRDPRDGKLKVIECNPRVTAAQELLVRSGLDLAELAYRDATGQPIAVTDGAGWKYGLTLWYPRQDFAAFIRLRRSGQLSFLEWLRTIMRFHVLPYFRFNDPVPSLVLKYRYVVRKISSIFH